MSKEWSALQAALNEIRELEATRDELVAALRDILEVAERNETGWIVERARATLSKLGD